MPLSCSFPTAEMPMCGRSYCCIVLQRHRRFVLPVRWAPAARARRTKGSCAMDWKLEVVVIPVTDIDRAKSFYVDQLGFHLDADT
jgi:hypothetical protein